MDTFIKAAAGVLLITILYLSIPKQAKDFSFLLSLGGCCIIALLTIEYCRPVFTFIDKLISLGAIDLTVIKTLVKAVGISLLAEYVSLLCADAGNAAVGKAFHLLASVMILWLSIPLLSNLIDLIEEILATV